MGKEHEKSVVRRSVKASVSAVKNLLDKSRVGDAVFQIQQELEDAVEQTKRKVAKIADHLSARVLSFSLVVMGMFFGFLGLAFFIFEYSKISLGTSFLIVGLLVLLLGWISLRKQ